MTFAVGIRFMTGAAVGFEFTPDEGIYFVLYFGILSLAFYNPEVFDTDE